MCADRRPRARGMSPGMGFVRSLRHQSSVSSPEHPDISEPPRWANRGGPGAASGGALGAANRGRANRKGCVFLAPVLSRSPSHPDGISISGKRLREPENPRSAQAELRCWEALEERGAVTRGERGLGEQEQFRGARCHHGDSVTLKLSPESPFYPVDVPGQGAGAPVAFASCGAARLSRVCARRLAPSWHDACTPVPWGFALVFLGKTG